MLGIGSGDLRAGNEARTAGDGGVMQQREKRRALDAYAAQAATQRGVAYIQHGAASLCRDAPETLDWRPERFGRTAQAKLVEDDEAGFLQHQAGADRTSRIELIKQRNAVALAREERSRGKAADPGAGNRDGKGLAHLLV